MNRHASHRSTVTLEHVFIQGVSVHCCIFISLYPDDSVPPSDKHPHSMTLQPPYVSGIGVVISGTWFPLNMRPGIRSLWANSSPATLPYGPDWCIAAEVVALPEGPPLLTEELGQYSHRVLDHLPN